MVAVRSAPAPELAEMADILRDLLWHLRQFGERAAGVNPLPSSELEVLRYVGDHPGSTVSDIARALERQSSNVSGTVRQLSQRGLLTRQVDEHDRRSMRLYPSEQAVAVRAEIDRVWVEALEGFVAQLPARDAEALLAARCALRQLAALQVPPADGAARGRSAAGP